MPFVIQILLLVAGLAALLAFLWWLINLTEGTYLGRRVVVWLYDISAWRYDNLKGFEPLLEQRYLAWPLMRHLGRNTAPLVLDVATGTGRVPRALLGAPGFNGRIVALDPSRRMLAQGVPHLAEDLAAERVYLVQQPARPLPFPDDCFDLVTCLEALEFLPRPRAAVAEFVRVTRPGGLLLLTNRRGRDAKFMPGKAWPRERALRIYQDEFGLQAVRWEPWQADYDLIWATKPGHSPPRRARPLPEIWCCPRCAHIALENHPAGYACDACGCTVRHQDGILTPRCKA
ncbi:MAG: class I SAM-dependent methyltransferase [Anaerolineales bacterium]